MQTFFGPRGHKSRTAAFSQLILNKQTRFIISAAVAGLLTVSGHAQETTTAIGQPLVVHANGADKLNRQALLRAKASQQGSVRVRVGLRSHSARERGLNVTDSADIEITQDVVASRVLGFARKNTAKKFKTLPVMSMTVTSDEVQRLANDPDVEWVREATTFHPTLELTRHLVGADAIFTGKSRVAMDGGGLAIAVIDTGVDDTHPMLNGHVITEAAACFSGNFSGGQSVSMCPGGGTTEIGPNAGRPCALDACWHGTHVASIAAGSGALNGIARGAQIIPVMAAFNNQNMVSLDDDDLYQALLYVYSLRNTYRIAAVNLSIGGAMFTSACDAYYPDYLALFDLLRQAGIAPVVSSGNMWSDNQISSPGCLSNAVSVGASTKSDQVAGFSNISKNLTLLAPGGSIHAAVPGGGYVHASGTSMAAPHVAGAFAVLKEANPAASIDELTSALVCSGKPLHRSRTPVVKPRIDLVGAQDALSGRSNRRWKFENSDESRDWADLRGNWSIISGAYVGQPDDTTFVGSMFSACNKSFVVRARMKIDETRTEATASRAGIVLGAKINYVENTFSGYWLGYTNATPGTASVMLVDGARLDGRSGGSATEICSAQSPVIYAGRANELTAEVNESGFTFNLNGTSICHVAGALSSQRIMIAGQFSKASSDKSLIVKTASVTARMPVVTASSPDAQDISQLAFTKRTVISVVRRPSEQN